MWLYFIWIPYAIIFYIITAFFSKKLNDDPKSLNYLMTLIIIQLFGIWPFVARYTNNIIFDSILFDLVIWAAYFITLLLMGCGKDFTSGQWVGVVLTVVGLVVLKFAE